MDFKESNQSSGITRRAMKAGIIQVKPEMNLGSSPDAEDLNSMHRAMAIVFTVGQWFALCPLQGIRSRYVEDLR